MNIGDTFYLRGPENPRPHLWVVLSDPMIDPKQVLVVNFTTERPDSDRTCIVGPGEHPCLSHTSSVNYARARILTDQQLEKAKEDHALDPQEPVSAELLRRIQAGAAVSDDIRNRHRQMLVDQGLCSD